MKMIRTAVISDLVQIMKIVEGSKKDMHSYGNYQWNEDYPKKEDFIKDITDQNLFAYIIENTVAGIICINKDEPKEYENASWTLLKEALIIHRLAVDSSFHGRGVGLKLIKHTNVICNERGIDYIKTDTNSLNIKAQKLLIKCGYTFTGDIGLENHSGKFYCYEKVLGKV